MNKAEVYVPDIVKETSKQVPDEIIKLMENIANNLQAVPLLTDPMLARLRLSTQFPEHFDHIENWLLIYVPPLALKLEKIKTRVEKVAAGGESRPKSDWLYSPCGSTLHKCAKQLRDIAQSLKKASQDSDLAKKASGRLPPGKPLETGQKTAPAKRRRIIGWIVEGIIALALLGICLYFFGVVTGIFVFAALLTIFHLLGWLGLIKDFTYNIWRPK